MGHWGGGDASCPPACLRKAEPWAVWCALKEPWQSPDSSSLLWAWGHHMSPWASAHWWGNAGTALSLTCKSQSLLLFPTTATPGTLRTCFSPTDPTHRRLEPWVLRGCSVPDVIHMTDSRHWLFLALSWMVILITFLRMERQWFTSSNHVLDLGVVVHKMSSTDWNILITEWKNAKEKWDDRLPCREANLKIRGCLVEK